MNLDLELYKYIEKEIGDHLEKHAAELVTGRAIDFADYKFRIGQLKGLRDALAIAERANRRAIGLDDKDERS